MDCTSVNITVSRTRPQGKLVVALAIAITTAGSWPLHPKAKGKQNTRNLHGGGGYWWRPELIIRQVNRAHQQVGPDNSPPLPSIGIVDRSESFS